MPDTAMFKRLAILIAVVGSLTAIAASYLQIRSQPSAIILSPERRSGKTVPLSNELRRCQQLGEAATRDPQCLQLWRENRDRFLNRQFRFIEIGDSDLLFTHFRTRNRFPLSLKMLQANLWKATDHGNCRRY